MEKDIVNIIIGIILIVLSIILIVKIHTKEFNTIKKGFYFGIGILEACLFITMIIILLIFCLKIIIE